MARLTGVDAPGLSLTSIIFAAVRRKLTRVPRPVRIHALNPPIIRGYAFMEGAQESAGSVPRQLKKLAQIRAATRICCPF